MQTVHAQSHNGSRGKVVKNPQTGATMGWKNSEGQITYSKNHLKSIGVPDSEIARTRTAKGAKRSNPVTGNKVTRSNPVS